MSNERKRIEREIGCIEIDTDWPKTPKPIDEIIEWLADMKRRGANEIDFSGHGYDGTVDEITLTANYAYEEPEEEYNLRLKQEADILKRRQELQLAEEKRMYERLKQKFG